MLDLTIQIVHYNTPRLLRETLRHLRSAAPKLSYEVIVVDNHPEARLPETLAIDFPEVIFLSAPKHLGFGGAQNFAFSKSRGRNILVFNPDIFVSYGNLEALVAFLDQHEDVGACGAQLRNADGSLQDSCYRFDRPFIKVLRRTPLRTWPRVRTWIAHHLMQDTDRTETMDVDWLMGACILLRREVFEMIGGFDERFLLYFEDTDLCRRIWMMGKRVVYYPSVVMVHYHRREGSQGNLFLQMFQRANWLHLQSWLRYSRKYARTTHPRV